MTQKTTCYKTPLLLIIIMLFPVLFMGQEVDEIIINNDLVAEYIYEFIEVGKSNGLSLGPKIRDKVDYILITPEENSIPNLAKTDKEKKYILLSKKLEIDSLILKMVLFRELWHMLGVPYDTSIIMKLKHNKGFTFSVYENRDIMDVEMNRVSDNYKLNYEK